MKLKKIVIFLLPLLMCLAPARAGGASIPPDPASTGETVGEQVVEMPQFPPSEEVNYVLESETARKMKQAKKAEDAKTYDSYGGGITLISMCIVIGALIVLSILFYIFGKISSGFMSHKKKQTAKARNAEDAPAKKNAPDTGDVIAAISAALAQHFATDHDKQDTILTIRRLRKAYSPWNSKIYNMRHLPEVIHNHPKK